MCKLKAIFIILFISLLLSDTLLAQTILELKDVVIISRTKNLTARRAYVLKKNAYWNWQIHKSNLRPQLRLDTQLLEFSRGVNPVIQSDGTYAIRTVNQNTSNASLALSQPIAAIGANVFVSSSLYRFDDISNNNHAYSSQPIQLGIQLPVFGFNHLKWDQKIKPVEFLESKKQYDWNLEQSTYKAVGIFFQNLSDRHEWNMAQTNLEMNTELFRISKEKFFNGQISKDELLQVKLMMINATKKSNAARVSMINSGLLLMTHLSLTEITDFTPVLPDLIPDFDITSGTAINLALENNPESIAFKRRLLQADQEVAYTKGNTGVSGNVNAAIGYASNFEKFSNWNQNISNHAVVQVGLSVPVIDWGRTYAARKQVSMNRELVQTTVMQEKIDFEKEIMGLVNIVMMLKENLEVVEQADSVSAQRYEIAHKRYLSGDISILELNMAQKEKDNASRDRLYTLWDFWRNYHQLRMITLYDFISQTSLVSTLDQEIGSRN
ncbi:MAG: TolC family protein [Bacteroidales bacterium]|nr:TolC family protein [Bacteroidales bacterium]